MWNFKRFFNWKNLTQVAFAKAIGVKQSQVGEWLKEKAKPGYDTLKNMAIAFNISADYFFRNKRILKNLCFPDKGHYEKASPTGVNRHPRGHSVERCRNSVTPSTNPMGLSRGDTNLNRTFLKSMT